MLLRYRLDIPQILGYFKHIASAYQQYAFKFKTLEEGPSLMNAFQKRNFKLVVDPVEQGIFYFEKGGSGHKSQCATKSFLLEKKNHLNHHQTSHFGQCVSRSTKSDYFVQSIANDDILASIMRIY